MATEEFLESAKFKEMLEEFNFKLEDFTCRGCDIEKECPYSYDPYNTNGDCLNK